PGTVVIQSSKDHTSQATFRLIVIEGNSSIVEKAGQPRPQSEQIADRLPEATLGQCPLAQSPRPDLMDDRPGALVAQPPPKRQYPASQIVIVSGHRRSRRHGPLNSIELANEIKHPSTRLRVMRFGLDELPSHVWSMTLTRATLDARATVNTSAVA